MCQLPRHEDEGDRLETMPVPIPSKTMPDALELERKCSLMMWHGNSAPQPDPIVFTREPGAAPQRTYHQSFSTAGRFLDGQAPGLRMTLLQGIKPEK